MRTVLLSLALIAAGCADGDDTAAPAADLAAGEDMSACTGSCLTARCADQTRDGDETDVDCGGMCGGCANGKACLVAGDCASGFCSMGSCAAKPAGMNCASDSQCASGLCGIGGSGNCCAAACTAGGSCGASGCDTTGACIYPATTVSCGAQSCATGTLTRHFCDGAGSCATDSVACPNHLACSSATSCNPSCGGDQDCVTGYYCANGCQPKAAAGTSCGSGNQCLSGACVDGYCCNTTCTGACQACAASLTGGANGTCMAVTDGQADPRGICMGATSICQAGACTGAPAAPGSVVATAGATSITLTWTVPAANGAPIDSFLVSGAGATPITVLIANVCAGTATGSACSYTVTSLTNCMSYTLGVAAHNVDGSSAVTSAGAAIPTARPARPATPTLTIPGSPGARMTVVWTAPADNGCAIDAYDVYISSNNGGNGGDHTLGVVTSATFTGLYTCNYPTGMCSLGYTFSIRAHNAGGWSDYSMGATAIPRVSFTTDNLPGIFSAKCTSCHGSGGTAPDLSGAAAYSNAVAAGALIYQCPEGVAGAPCVGHPVLLTPGQLDDTTLKQWVSDGDLQ